MGIWDYVKSYLPTDLSLTKEKIWTICGLLGAALAVKLYVRFTSGWHRIEGRLDGKVVIITGGTSGIGRAAAHELAKHGATVHILARDEKKGDRVVSEMKKSSGNNNIYFHRVDLMNYPTVRAFVDFYLSKDWPIHILINNAAMTNPTKKITPEGVEETIQSNHLGHFLLTNLLLDRIVSSRPSRIINTSSLVHRMADGFDPKDFRFEKTPFEKHGGFLAYSWSKLAAVLFTRELARRLYGRGVTVNVVDPGVVRTEAETLQDFPIWNPVKILYILPYPFLKSPYLGAQTALYCATAKELTNVSGHYFADCHPAVMSFKALDDKLANDLWNESEKLTNLISKGD